MDRGVWRATVHGKTAQPMCRTESRVSGCPSVVFGSLLAPVPLPTLVRPLLQKPLLPHKPGLPSSLHARQAASITVPVSQTEQLSHFPIVTRPKLTSESF